MNIRCISALAAAAIAVMGLAACSSTAPTSTPVASATPTVSPAPTASGTTFGQLAQQGQGVFATRCSGCHGQNGQGATAPAVLGAGANLGKYGDAQKLLDFISTAMPFNAPGSLSADQYRQVLSFFLVENSFVTAGTAFNASQLGSVSLQ